jgi:hypothetical protein
LRPVGGRSTCLLVPLLSPSRHRHQRCLHSATAQVRLLKAAGCSCTCWCSRRSTSFRRADNRLSGVGSTRAIGSLAVVHLCVEEVVSLSPPCGLRASVSRFFAPTTLLACVVVSVSHPTQIIAHRRRNGPRESSLRALTTIAIAHYQSTMLV